MYGFVRIFFKNLGSHPVSTSYVPFSVTLMNDTQEGKTWMKEGWHDLICMIFRVLISYISSSLQTRSITQKFVRQFLFLYFQPEEIADLMLKLQDETKCHNINFVTPEHVVPQVNINRYRMSRLSIPQWAIRKRELLNWL